MLLALRAAMGCRVPNGFIRVFAAFHRKYQGLTANAPPPRQVLGHPTRGDSRVVQDQGSQVLDRRDWKDVKTKTPSGQLHL